MLFVQSLDVQAERRRLGLAILGVGNLAILEHGPQHLVAPLARGLRVDQRRIGRRAAGQAGQKRRLRQRELVQMLAEEELRRRLKAEVAVAERDQIRVHREDLRLW